MEKIKIPAGVAQRAASAAHLTNVQAAPPASESLQTRAAFYARKNGGGLRMARKQFVCQTPLCLKKIEPGTAYFDTLEVTTWPKTRRICCSCSEELV